MVARTTTNVAAASPACPGRGGVESDEEALRLVTRRAKSQVTVDWLRLAGPKSRLDRVIRAMDEVCDGEAESVGGRYFCSEGLRWPNGGAVYWTVAEPSGDVDGRLVVEVPGGVLGLLSAAGVHDLLQVLLMQGLHCTRLDIAVDLIGERWKAFDLIGKIAAAYDAGQLCRCRTMEQVEQRRSGVVTGRTVYLGRRGKFGSGRLVRVYDKGLESQVAAEGEWTRYELELSGDCAAQAALELANVAPGEYQLRGFEIAVGAVDFRENNGSREMKRRPRVKWWEEFIAGVDPLRVVERRERTELDKWRGWMLRCVAPTLEGMARASGLELENVWTDLMRDQGVPVRIADECRVVIWEWLRERAVVE